jgi:nucleotide-binding universal stress UspA family protein
MYSKMLVPIDGSEPSTLALEKATKLAHMLRASIFLLHVVDVPSLLTATATATAASYEALLDMMRRDGAELLRNAAATISRTAIKVEILLEDAPHGTVGECVLGKARDHMADLIVCGTHGQSGVRRLLLGSDAEHIVRHSPIPILLVRVP